MSEEVARQGAKTGSQIHGFDYLRAVMSWAVVAWHMLLLGEPSPVTRGGYSVSPVDILSFNFLLLAVPCFFLMSLYLLAVRAPHKPTNYLWTRLQKIGILYAVWTALLLVASRRWHVLKFEDAQAAFLFFVSAGGTLFYFFFSLLCFAFLTWFAARWSKFVLWLLFGFTCALLLLMPFGVERWGWDDNWVVYWNPINFLPCAFIAALAARQWPGNVKPNAPSPQFVFVLALLFIVISLAEWRWLAHFVHAETINYALPTYTRVSVILGGALCFLGAFLIRRPAPRAIAFAADYSLGLYCLHPFVLMVARRLPLGVLPEAIAKIAQFGFTLALSYVAVYLVRRVIKDFI